MRPVTDFDPEYVSAMAEHWPDSSLLRDLERGVEEHPQRVAVVDYRASTGERRTLTYRELADAVQRISAGLLRLGVQPGDVVSVQLPNWWQVPAIHLACLRIGAITNAVMAVFRERELEFMLRLAETRVFIVPRMFRNFDHADMARRLQARLPDLRSVVVVDPGGGPLEPDSFDALLMSAGMARVPAGLEAGPDEVIQIAYTSGTTGEPKGALLTANTLLSNVDAFAERLGIGPHDVTLMASPLAHQTGFMYGVLLPLRTGGTVVLQDVWDGGVAATLIHREAVTFTMAALPFLVDLNEVAAARPDAFRTLRLFLCAGAPIPRALVPVASARLGASIVPGWGMTEMGAVTVATPEDPIEAISGTDGRPLPGVELRIVDHQGLELPTGTEGRLQARACSLFGGYLKRPGLKNVDDGWFDSGDLARLDDDGYVRLTGRSKDIIIRGGENIPVVEVEGLLTQHPEVLAAAIVGAPDPRLGERAVAFVVPRGGSHPAPTELLAFLSDSHVARQYLPEHIEIVDDLPRTASGKVQKFRLREMARSIEPAWLARS